MRSHRYLVLKHILWDFKIKEVKSSNTNSGYGPTWFSVPGHIPLIAWHLSPQLVQISQSPCLPVDTRAACLFGMLWGVPFWCRKRKFTIYSESRQRWKLGKACIASACYTYEKLVFSLLDLQRYVEYLNQSKSWYLIAGHAISVPYIGEGTRHSIGASLVAQW